MKRPNDLLKNRGLLPLALVFGTLVAGILIGTLITGEADAARDVDEPVTDATPLAVPPADPVENQFSELARKVRPSVVSIVIEAEREPEAQSEQRPFSEQEEFFRRFFGMPPRPGVPDQTPRRRGPGQGSGVIVDPKGYIITNQHVVADAGQIKVSFVDDEEEYGAELIGVDVETDLAVIRVEGKRGMQAARIGNSDAANVGDWAVAIGSPFGYDETVTVGIISAKSREMIDGTRSRPFKKFLQTDAAINPGNSGGPLLNIRGEVIGINTAIISRTGGYDGIGFALASNIAVDTYNQIIRFGRVSRGSIGVRFSGNQNPSLFRSYGADGGVFVEEVTKGGPAQDAGMRGEDIIISVDGTKIDDGDELIKVVSGISVGKTVPIEVVRNGKTVTLDVKIADRGKLFPEQAMARRTDPEVEEASVRFGITVQEIGPERREQLGLEVEGGVMLTKIDADSFAEEVGLRPGDVVLAVNREAVNSIGDLRAIQKELQPGMDVAFKLMRTNGEGWRTLYLADVLPE